MSVLNNRKGLNMKTLTLFLTAFTLLLTEVEAGCGGCGPSKTHKAENEIRAFRNNCTHSGWDLRPFVNGVSVCSSGHGGRFNTNGTAIASPASGTLRQYDTVLDGNSLTIYS